MSKTDQADSINNSIRSTIKGYEVVLHVNKQSRQLVTLINQWNGLILSPLSVLGQITFYAD